MANETTPDDPDLEPEPADGARHYLHDPNGISQNARDEDEQDQDDLLEIDQTELEELGLDLDDPHQPESE
jgi:hypothetical protein